MPEPEPHIKAATLVRHCRASNEPSPICRMNTVPLRQMVSAGSFRAALIREHAGMMTASNKSTSPYRESADIRRAPNRRNLRP